MDLTRHPATPANVINLRFQLYPSILDLVTLAIMQGYSFPSDRGRLYVGRRTLSPNRTLYFTGLLMNVVEGPPSVQLAYKKALDGCAVAPDLVITLLES